MIIPSRRHASSFAVAASAVIGGALVAVYYQRLGLTLSHYDARGHLVVARRIVDSLTPGWHQIGAIWLPVPHLLNAIPVQIDAFYRSGASGVILSIAAFALAAGSIAWIATTVTGSSWAAVAAAAVFILNPNVLYLQATPMTEPLLLGLITLAIALLMEWCRAPAGLKSCPTTVQMAGPESRPTSDSCPTTRAATSLSLSWGRSSAFAEAPADRRSLGGGWSDLPVRETGLKSCSTSHAVVGWAFALACLTRYEAWPVTVCALTAALWARWRGGDTLAVAARDVGRIACFPAVAVLGFLLFSRIVIGEWLVTSGFFVPDNPVQGRPLAAAGAIWWGVRMLSGDAVVVLAAAGLAALVAIGLSNRQRAWVVVATSLAGAAAVPWYAFVSGHPYRIRYMVPLVAAEAVGVGALFAVSKLARPAVGLVLLVLIAFELKPIDPRAPMVVEAQWDRPNAAGRQDVTACLAAEYAGETIMASMGSLGHYMQELSRAGLDLRDFLHEGNGDIWLSALGGARPYAGWILIEERAEGGDMLAAIARENPGFLDGFSRVCEGAGVALYKRQNSMLNVAR